MTKSTDLYLFIQTRLCLPLLLNICFLKKNVIIYMLVYPKNILVHSLTLSHFFPCNFLIKLEAYCKTAKHPKLKTGNSSSANVSLSHEIHDCLRTLMWLKIFLNEIINSYRVN